MNDAARAAQPLRMLFVVQRYGREVTGGAEGCCRHYASRLAARGHDVHVLTSCALSYVDWANHYPEGADEIDGVTVHRLRASMTRPSHRFELASARVVGSALEGAPTPSFDGASWMHLMGPTMPGLESWMAEHAATYDVIVFYTYLYYTTYAGIRAAAGRTATVFHPTAHREPYIALPLFDELFHLADGYGFLTDEEATHVGERFGCDRPSMVTGIGVDLDVVPPPGAVERFRHELGLGTRPYLLYVGRVDPNKGTTELFDFFRAYRRRRPERDIALVVAGERVSPIPADLEGSGDLIAIGVLDDDALQPVRAGATALVNPSYFESFSMVVTEMWAHARPVLVQGGCDVMTGQCRRSGGGLPYDGYEEFEAAVDLLLDEPATAEMLGRRGRAFVEEHYEWSSLLSRYERFLGEVIESSRARWNRPATPPAVRR